MEPGTSSRSPRLSELPNEILSLILGHFCLHCRETRVTPQAFYHRTGQQQTQPSWYSLDCQSLHSACLVSTRLRDVAQPLLYHQFAPGYGDSLCTTQPQSCWSLLPFLRTVARRPDLAAQVRHFHLSRSIMELSPHNHQAEVEPVLEEASRARGIQLSEFLGPFQDWWPSTTRAQYRPCGLELATMLLACLPNLACLSLTAIPSLAHIPLSALRAAHLSKLRIQTLDTVGYSAIADVILEAASSSVQTLNLHMLDGADQEALQALARPLPKLRNLCITISRVKFDILSFFHSHLRDTESFIYEGVQASSLDDFLPPNAVEQLLRNKDTVKSLHLDVRLRSHNASSRSEASFRELMHGLPSFSALQYLFINTLLLSYNAHESPYDDDVLTKLLPPSIVTLRLADNTVEPGPGMSTPLGKSLCCLAEAVLQGQFPNLKTVQCDTEQRLDDYDLSGVFANVGVDFGYESWLFTDKTSRRQALHNPPGSQAGG